MDGGPEGTFQGADDVLCPYWGDGLVGTHILMIYTLPMYWTGKGQFSFQSQRKAMPKNAQTTAQLHSSHTLVK